MTLWKFLPPGVTKIGTFFKSGNIWLETEIDYTTHDFANVIHYAMSDVFEHYKKIDSLEYLKTEYETYNDNKDRFFLIQEFKPPCLKRFKELTNEIKVVEEKLYYIKKEQGDFIKKVENTFIIKNMGSQDYNPQRVLTKLYVDKYKDDTLQTHESIVIDNITQYLEDSKCQMINKNQIRSDLLELGVKNIGYFYGIASKQNPFHT